MENITSIERTRRFLTLFKLDAKSLFNRIKARKAEYIEVFGIKRSRDHFSHVFFSRYYDAKFTELVSCSVDVIAALDQFYSTVDDLYWYLSHTEDMPATVEEEVERYIRRLERLHDTLNLYLDAELGVHDEHAEGIGVQSSGGSDSQGGSAFELPLSDFSSEGVVDGSAIEDDFNFDDDFSDQSDSANDD